MNRSSIAGGDDQIRKLQRQEHDISGIAEVERRVIGRSDLPPEEAGQDYLIFNPVVTLRALALGGFLCICPGLFFSRRF
ncbi:hypothetical protein [Mesorhizobium sp. INR15]|uniref:hypothetical protein n=1 Tax=Mesorhizobium sp. INR15 TaxID=2654248 RepID=UPI00189644E4|nr:hypothetical protein [Mesorhizobium sp. INR15]QPC91516.1 hypothetical protein GA829_13350 [Mesorhizobium sp. INR15]